MLKLLIFVSFFLYGCAAQNKVTYIGVSPDAPINEIARVYNTTSGIRIVSIDGQKYSKSSFERLNDEALFISPGKHSISIEFCICSGDGSQYIEGIHTFTETFEAGHEYGLIFNYAPPDRHEFWLSHVYINKKGRTKKELMATIGPFELKRTKTTYVPVILQ